MIERFYKDIQVKRDNSTGTGSFGNSQANYVDSSIIKGFTERASSSQILAGGKHQEKVTDSLYAEPTSDVLYGDILVLGEKNYRVVTHPENVSDRNHHLEALLERLDTDA